MEPRMYEMMVVSDIANPNQSGTYSSLWLTKYSEARTIGLKRLGAWESGGLV